MQLTTKELIVEIETALESNNQANLIKNVKLLIKKLKRLAPLMPLEGEDARRFIEMANEPGNPTEALIELMRNRKNEI